MSFAQKFLLIIGVIGALVAASSVGEWLRMGETILFVCVLAASTAAMVYGFRPRSKG